MVTILKNSIFRLSTLSLFVISNIINSLCSVHPVSSCFGSSSSSGNKGPAPNQNLPPDQYNQLGDASTVGPQQLIPIGTSSATSSYPNGCGHSKYWNTADSRILGGVNAMPNDFPWQVRLSINSGSNAYLCGATIINSQWLLTAAHCGVLTSDPTSITAYFADHDIAQNDSGEFSLKMARIVNHPRYNSKTLDMDFSLLKLPRAIDFSSWNVQPVCLPNSCSDECQPGDTVFISGWGTTDEGGYSSKILQKAKLPIASNDKCVQAYRTSSSPVTANMVCAGYDEGMVDSCQGDSGGPLTCPKYGYFMLMGVTSHGIGCGRAGLYGVYARVCKVLDWIGATVGTSKSLYYFSLTNDTKSLGSNSNRTRTSDISFFSRQLNSGDGSAVPVITGGEPPVPAGNDDDVVRNDDTAETTTRGSGRRISSTRSTTSTTTTMTWRRLTRPTKRTTTTTEITQFDSVDGFDYPLNSMERDARGKGHGRIRT